jgi:hypothetical protein
MVLGSGNEDFYGVAIVCYIDILGFSNDIFKNWKNQKNDPLEKILGIKNNIPVYVPREDTSVICISINYIPKIFTVSDSIIIGFGLEKDYRISDLISGFKSVLNALIHIWKNVIDYGYTIRGAIEFGEIYWNRNEIIGPAFIGAYKLESEISKTSRIIISSNFNRKLKEDIIPYYGDNLILSPIKYFYKDIDGYIVINPKLLVDIEIPILTHPDLFHEDPFGYGERKKYLLEKIIRIKDNAPAGIIREKYNSLIYKIQSNEEILLKIDDFGNY